MELMVLESTGDNIKAADKKKISSYIYSRSFGIRNNPFRSRRHPSKLLCTDNIFDAEGVVELGIGSIPRTILHTKADNLVFCSL